MPIKEIVTSVLISGVALEFVETELLYGDFSQEASEYDSSKDKAFKQDLEEAGLIVEFVSHFGGEGEGDQYWSVYKFTKGDESCHVKFDGYYASYNGAEFQKWFFVEPKEVMVIEWAVTK